ncbi:uncharacterized protein LOC126739052 [Anthonomus grandis grandis]|uniref:uncharacterized protein LOC126739052 n=1 Tax=Anthonomus grandis grandis TaxID=2921223 RepID=UPI002166BBAF|nr:uncharacterized protein LOC126739052 [Anthonomus grandis grandis]
MLVFVPVFLIAMDENVLADISNTSSDLNKSSLPNVELLVNFVFSQEKNSSLCIENDREASPPCRLLFDPEDKDDDIADPDYILSREEQQNINMDSDSDLEVRDVTFNNIEETGDNIEEIGEADSQEDTESDVKENRLEILNKKRPRTSKEKVIRNKNKHPIGPPTCNCKTKKCLNAFDSDKRKDLHTRFWSLDKDLQTMWLYKQIHENKAKRKRLESRRNFSRTYTLPKINANGEDEQVKVCQKFFMTTLGYKSTMVVNYILKKNKDLHGTQIATPLLADQREKWSPPNKKSKTPIKDHINSYNRKPSHYRRAHGPNRKYLPAELSIRDLYKDYNEIYLSF